jgi:hypothetical protein
MERAMNDNQPDAAKVLVARGADVKAWLMVRAQGPPRPHHCVHWFLMLAHAQARPAPSTPLPCAALTRHSVASVLSVLLKQADPLSFTDKCPARANNTEDPHAKHATYHAACASLSPASPVPLGAACLWAAIPPRTPHIASIAPLVPGCCLEVDSRHAGRPSQFNYNFCLLCA